jgi:long-chain fatty acid transport protein
MADRVFDRLTACFVLALLAAANTVHGAGFYSPSVGSPGSLGTAGVANPTNTRGADASWTNPAGMTGIDRQHILSGFQVIVPSVKFNAKSAENNAILPRRLGPVRGNNGGNAADAAPVPSFFYVRPLSDRLRFGLASTAPLGGGVDYGKDFVGRYAVRDVTLAGLALTPSLAYRMTDKLSIGAGISVIYTTLDQSTAIRQGAPSPELDGRVKFEDLDDWGVQAVLGLTYAFSDDLLLGIVYRSQMDTDLEGNVKYEGLRNPQLAASLPRDVQISWTNPQWLEAGLRYRLDDKTQLYANAGWQEWSKFSENTLGFRDDRVIVSDRNWDDTWHAGVAAVRVLSPKAFVSVGVSYESSPVTDKYRTLDFPVDEQWMLSASYAWKHNDNLAFALGATLAFTGDAALEQTAQRVTVRGDYDTNMLAILGGTLRYDF